MSRRGPDFPDEFKRFTDDELRSLVGAESTVPLQEEIGKLVDCPNSDEVCKLCPRSDVPGKKKGEPVCSGPITGRNSPPIRGCRYHPDRFDNDRTRSHRSQPEAGAGTDNLDDHLKDPDEITIPSQTENRRDDPPRRREPDDLEIELERHLDELRDEVVERNDEPDVDPALKAVGQFLDLVTGTSPSPPSNRPVNEMTAEQKINYVMNNGGVLKADDGRRIIKCPENPDAICGLYQADGKTCCTGPNPGWVQDTYLGGLIKGREYTARRNPYDSCPHNPHNKNL
jgi:hypothetical protein